MMWKQRRARCSKWRATPFGAPGGVNPIQDSARELKAFIDRVLRESGAAEVDLVGHSEGTFMPQ
jgi:triacylglycerol esterase/lipase EstA (alpha/beta hydrolase family)